MGHLGTLDPLAEGVLPIYLGKMTKLISLFNGLGKTYKATLFLGATSTTLDAEGEIKPVPVPEGIELGTIKKVLAGFEGESWQLPPMYSAVKVGGKQLYKYARKGVEIKREPRKIVIDRISDIELQFPFLRFDVRCSKGVYIRTLADDIGKALHTGAYLNHLVRTEIGGLFFLESAFGIDQITKLIEIHDKSFLFPLYDLIKNFHRLKLKSTEEVGKIKNGLAITVPGDYLLPFEEDQMKSKNVAFAFDKDENIIAIGGLEFSQDLFLKFSPNKVLI